MRCTREELKEALKIFASYYNGSDEDLRSTLLDVACSVEGSVRCETVPCSKRAQAKLVLEAVGELITNYHLTFKKNVTNKETPMKESTITVKPLTESTFKPLEITLQINKEEDLVALLAQTLVPTHAVGCYLVKSQCPEIQDNFDQLLESRGKSEIIGKLRGALKDKCDFM